MWVHAVHSIYIHCTCHRFQLASMQAAHSIPDDVWSPWKLFFCSPKRAENLKEVQSVLKLLKLKIVKPSNTRWLSHKHSVWAACIYQKLRTLIVTQQQLYHSLADAETYGLSTLLATYTAVASVVFHSEVLDILARINVTMQRKNAAI